MLNVKKFRIFFDEASKFDASRDNKLTISPLSPLILLIA